MTDFTKNQLEAIMTELNKISALSDHTKDTILSNLEKPAPIFRQGEVVMTDDEVLCHASGNLEYDKNIRHLTPEEVPALKLAMERLEIITDNQMDVACFLQDIAKKALDDIKAML